MLIGGVGARLVFAIAAGNGAGPAIARFEHRAPHHRVPPPWVAALVMMALADVLTRLAVIYSRGAAGWRRPRRPRHASRQPPAPDLQSRPAAVHAVSTQARLAVAGPRHGAWRGTAPPGWLRRNLTVRWRQQMTARPGRRR